MTSPRLTPRLTAVQKDVLDRLRDGWELYGTIGRSYGMHKRGEAYRHVAAVTVDSLVARHLICHDGQGWFTT